MSTIEAHIESEKLAASAHDAARAGQSQKAKSLFAQAAIAEARAFGVVGDNKPRTLGILAVSAAALWYKSGELEAAEQFAHDASRRATLPGFAR
jgi:hypothetical protein